MFEKALESLKAAELCFVDKLYASTVNRAYYAIFQAAVVALAKSGIRPQGEQWSHSGLQAAFAKELTQNRKIFRVRWLAISTMSALFGIRLIIRSAISRNKRR